MWPYHTFLWSFQQTTWLMQQSPYILDFGSQSWCPLNMGFVDWTTVFKNCKDNLFFFVEVGRARTDNVSHRVHNKFLYGATQELRVHDPYPIMGSLPWKARWRCFSVRRSHQPRYGVCSFLEYLPWNVPATYTKGLECSNSKCSLWANLPLDSLVEVYVVMSTKFRLCVRHTGTILSTGLMILSSSRFWAIMTKEEDKAQDKARGIWYCGHMCIETYIPLSVLSWKPVVGEVFGHKLSVCKSNRLVTCWHPPVFSY